MNAKAEQFVATVATYFAMIGATRCHTRARNGGGTYELIVSLGTLPANVVYLTVMAQRHRGKIGKGPATIVKIHVVADFELVSVAATLAVVEFIKGLTEVSSLRWSNHRQLAAKARFSDEEQTV